jgi:rsbT co-antagonist protein RsbR
MNGSQRTRIPQLIQRHQQELLDEWMKEQKSADTFRGDLISDNELRAQSQEFLELLKKSSQDGDLADLKRVEWDDLKDFLNDISRSRSHLGFSPSETATFIFSFKQPLFHLLQEEYSQGDQALIGELWSATRLLDSLGLYVTESYQRAREEVIERQQMDMLELSTPVVKLWEGILALPLIGSLDSSRTQIVMESLLEKIVATGSEIAIIDITGVPTVDTLTAQHLLKTVAAARLMGAECIISGIRPQIAQTVIHLGLDLSVVTTRATLADAFKVALKKTGLSIIRKQSLEV